MGTKITKIADSANIVLNNYAFELMKLSVCIYLDKHP